MIKAQELCASYADQLRNAAFSVETAVQETPYGTYAGLVARKDIYQLTAEWVTGVPPARTRFEGAWCGAHPDSPNFQPRKAQSVRAIDDLIALEDLSQWRTVPDFQRWTDERSR